MQLGSDELCAGSCSLDFDASSFRRVRGCFEVVKSHINLTLLKCNENARKQNMKIMDFINLYHDEVLLLLPDAALAKIIGHTGRVA